MRLIFATQVVDADDPHLAITLDLLGALAERVDELVVLTDRVRRHELPANVRFREFGARSRAGRALRFERAAVAELRRRPTGFLAHMVPQYVLLAAPPARAFRVPVALWYTHWHASRALRRATGLADVVLSVNERSFPLETPKVRGIGHAIDLARFAPAADRQHRDGRLRLLALGRTERRKGLPLLLDAVELATERGLDLELEIRGPQITEAERTHRGELEARIAASTILRDRARVAEPVAREHVPGLIAGADVVVNPTRGDTAAGALDKVVYEAAACGVPVLASNPLLADVLGAVPERLLFRADDADDLVAALAVLAAAGPDRRLELGRELRSRVEERHSLSSWADAVVASVAPERAGRRRSDRSRVP
jgi:glycosyltransferase involved in cell wall biosynthesis